MKKAKKTQTLKTFTIGTADDPHMTLCPGHVDAKTYNKASAAEGWKGGLAVDPSELRYEYWVKQKKTWKKSTPGKKGAQPVTVSDW